MCGRFALALPPKSIAEHFELDACGGLVTRYNIAPTQDAATIDGNNESGRTLAMRRWGLVPRWSKDVKIGARMINARSETAAEKPSFSASFEHHRCLVPASGFFEWHRKSGEKRPRYYRLKSGAPLAFAGLWDRWEKAGGEPLETFTILTTSANDLVGKIHDRMPVILQPADYNRWLDTSGTSGGDVRTLLRPFAPELMESIPVGIQVNSPSHDQPDCIAEYSDLSLF